MPKSLTCIICPRGCHLEIDDDLNVTGNSCPRGEKYAKQEITDPRRTVTSTVRVESDILPMLPVKTKDAVKKGDVLAVMEALNKIVAHPPIYIGDVICENIAGTGIDLVATRELLH